MPLNKEALIRYRVINRTLLDYKYANMEQLIEACEQAMDISPISVRTLMQDMHDMKYDSRLGYHAPIAYCRHRRAYYYKEPDYSIDRIPLGAEELKALSFASGMLEHYSEAGIFRTFKGAVQKISDAVRISRMNDSGDAHKFIYMEKSPGYRGSNYLSPLIDAILNKTVLKISYKKFDDETARDHIVHPALLKEFHNRWYLLGLDEASDSTRTFGLDRIENIHPDASLNFRHSQLDHETYFSDTYGVTAFPLRAETVRLKFSKQQAQYLLTKPLHESQTVICQDSDSVTLQFILRLNYEFISTILGWGQAVEVLKPAELRKKIADALKCMLAKYE
jgi:predicted DNA-binding transcriptional regulator YafY